MSQSGYEITLKLFLPANPADHESMARASKTVHALVAGDTARHT